MMIRPAVAVAVAAVAVAAAFGLPAAAAQGPVAHTVYGDVLGSVDAGSGVSVWHSIPFAAPPTGSLRYAPPNPPAKWSGVKNATGAPNECAQLDLVGLTHKGDEDCLYLHVYSPKNATNAPVLFWIYGGGFIEGTSATSKYNGAALAAKYGVVVVAANYRLGPFGFMAMPALASETKNGTTGNYGPLDQQAALRWTRDNIANFGGDPSQVTIFGESAGGFSVCWQLASAGSAGLFRAAIMESGSCDSPIFFQAMDRAVRWSVEFAAAAGCNSTVSSEVVDCMRGKSTEEVMLPMLREFSSSWPFPSGSGPSYLPGLAPLMPWGPAIDMAHEGLMAKPIDLFNKGADSFNAVPVIFGTNLNEGTLFAPALGLLIHKWHLPPTDDDVAMAILHLFGAPPTGGNSHNFTIINETVAQVMDRYPASAFPDNWYRAARCITEMFFYCGTRRSLRAIHTAGVPTYMYRFTFPIEGLEYELLGVTHGSEVSFVFQSSSSTSPNKDAMEAAFGGYWSSMAIHTDPSDGRTAGNPVWPQYTGAGGQFMNMTVPPSATAPPADLEARCDWWDSVYDIVNDW